MSVLEWKEPTIEEIAAWDYELQCGGWAFQDKHKQNGWVTWWRSWLESPDKQSRFVMGRDLYTLARAVEFERRVEEAYSEADNEVLAFGFEPPSSRARKVVERRDALQSTLIEARQRVDTLTAKVLGRQP